MLNKESIYVILFSIPIYQLLFYTVQLVSFRRKNPSKKYLGLLLLSMTAFLLMNAIHFLGYNDTFAYLYFIYLPVLLSVAPAYFLYILSITQENHDVNKRQRLILFSPAIAMLVANIIFLGTMDHASRIALVDQESIINGLKGDGIGNSLVGFWIIGILLVFAQIAFAIIKVSQIIHKETELMNREPSHLAYLEWKWILGISISVLIFLIINVMIEMVLPMKMLGIAVVYNFLMLAAGGLSGYMGMKQDDLLNLVEKVAQPERAATEPASTEEPAFISSEAPLSFISSSEAENIHKRIIEYLQTEKPYLKPDFSLQDLCNNLNVSRRKISYVMNDVMDRNFYGIINEYRIKEAEDLILDQENSQIKIEVLGEMVGFQSKSSFNACFKKMTGMTPSEYRQRHKSNFSK
ncbi:MAG: helix-turn-helix domain-containing protein [Bacteroidales bacterium]|jgi:AraC-like DNA-binding protein|nr:helix-turn-helix domain-containing protein [Bacteroidales bacterium]